MKTKIYLLVLATILGFGQLNATIITVDNNMVVSGSPGQYSDLQAACTAAFAGDTILVVGSPNSYGSAQITKKLILLGPGLNPQRPNTKTATISGITISNGASNSIISGFSVWTVGFGNSLVVQNVTISKNNIFSLYFTNISTGILVFNNLITGEIKVNSATNVIISNNIIKCSYICDSNNTSVSIKNNLFIDCSQVGAFVRIAYAEISNNIILEKTFPIPQGSTVENCTFNNNLTYNCLPNSTIPFGTNVGSGNKINQDPVFLRVEGGFSFANNYGLHSTSPCKNAGTDGTDIGPSGGSYPLTNVFPITGHPTIPYISQMQINGASSVPVGNSKINITVKAKKQN